MKIRVRALAWLVVLASGCSVNSLLDRIDNESEKSVDLVCSCTNVFPDRAMCEQQFGSYLGLFDRDCLEDALAEDKDASKETLKCILDQAKAFNRCLEDKLQCDDPMSIQGCDSTFETECPDLPAAVQAKVSACGDTD